MSARSRYIESGACYEVCFRVRQGLPFPTLLLIALLLRSAVARANRGGRISISHMLWMANHPHMIIRAFDAEALRLFLMETQRKTTEYVKRLLGLRYLQLWEGEAQVSKILDLDEAVERIAYLYLNPARANLVESIAEYQGLNTWKEFNSSLTDLNTCVSTDVPWIRFPAIKKLRSRKVTAPEDRLIVEELSATSKRRQRLEIKPNDWMEAFGITSSEAVAAINARIRKEVAVVEKSLSLERAAKGYSVLGTKRLRSQEILKSHTPKKHQRRNFVLSSSKDLRIAYIKKVKAIFAECRRLYHLASRGEIVIWPPGVFPPAIKPLANALA